MVAWVCNMVRQHALLVKRLKVAEAKWTFISHCMSNGEKLRAKLEGAESDLTAAQKVATEGTEALKLIEGEKETIHTKADKLREEGRAVKAKFKEAK